MRDEVQRLARRAAAGDLVAAKRLVSALESGSAPVDDFDLAERLLSEWYRGVVERVAEGVVSDHEAGLDYETDDPLIGFQRLVEERESFGAINDASLALYGFAVSPRGAAYLNRGRGPTTISTRTLQKQFVAYVFVLDVLDRIKSDPTLRGRMRVLGHDVDSWEES